MSRRRAAAEETRRRIIAATMELHAARGVLNTSWEDIAARAGVAVGTVYRHFPTLEELVPACGEASMARLALPADDELEALFGGARGRRQRLRRLVATAFDVYDRGSEVVVAIRRDKDALTPMAEAHAVVEERLDALVAAALSPLAVDDAQRGAVRALVDLDVWQALARQAIVGERARDLVSDLIDRWLAAAARR